MVPGMVAGFGRTLAALGHDVYAPSLRGLGEDAANLASDIGL